MPSPQLDPLFQPDVNRLVRLAQEAGLTASRTAIIRAWQAYSSAWMATWLSLDEDDASVLQTLQQYLTLAPASQFDTMVVQLEETTDGSGDAILPLPDQVLQALGVKEGDSIELTVDEHGAIHLRKA